MKPYDVSPDWMPGFRHEDWVSVVIPVYNREDLIVEALDSVHRQTYRPIEVVVVDDGSEDETGEAVQAWEDSNTDEDGFEVRYLYQENTGGPAARNRGLRASRGAYIQFLDSDDLLLAHKIERQHRRLHEQKVDMVYCTTDVLDAEGETIGRCGQEIRGTGIDVPEYSWHISGPLYRRSTVRELGPWLESLTGNQDWEYCARAKLHDFSFHFDETVGSVYRQHDSGRISNPSFQYEYTRSAEKAYDHIWALAEERDRLNKAFSGRIARLYLYRALEYRCHGFEDEARRCLDKADRSPVQKDLAWVMIQACKRIPHRWWAQLLLQLTHLRSTLLTGNPD